MKILNPVIPSPFLALILTLVLLSSCKNENFSPEIVGPTDDSSLTYSFHRSKFIDSIKNTVATTFNPASEKVKLEYGDASGNPLNKESLALLKSGRRTLALCDEDYVDDGTYICNFKGVSYNYYPSDNYVIINAVFELHIPANISPSGNLGYVKLLDAGGSLPNLTKSAVPQFEYTGTYKNGVFNTDFNKYRVDYSVVVNYADFCNYELYQARLKIGTDCELIPSFVSSYTSSINLTIQSTYQPEYVYAYSSSPGILRIEQLTILSMNCHYSALGSSPKYVVEYKVSGTNTWTQLSTPLTQGEVRLITLAPGSYDYRYRGLLSSSPVDLYSNYTSAGGTATVY